MHVSFRTEDLPMNVVHLLYLGKRNTKTSDSDETRWQGVEIIYWSVRTSMVPRLPVPIQLCDILDNAANIDEDTTAEDNMDFCIASSDDDSAEE